MSFPAAYREKLLSAVESIGTGRVARAIQWMQEAREAGRLIFVAGNGGSAALAELNIHVPEPHMGRIENADHIVCHMICYSFMDQDQNEYYTGSKVVSGLT